MVDQLKLQTPPSTDTVIIPVVIDPNVIAGPGLPAIPEPSTWAMMSLGLAALVWRVRRT